MSGAKALIFLGTVGATLTVIGIRSETVSIHSPAAHLFIFGTLLGGAYLLPWIVAKVRGHHNSGAIFALNLFLGWSVIGWFGALVWALTNPPPSPVVYRDYR